jgi:Flp pilus assembly protein TadD
MHPANHANPCIPQISVVARSATLSYHQAAFGRPRDATRGDGETAMESRGHRRFRHPWLGPVSVGVLALLLGLGHVLDVRDNPFFYRPIIDAFDYDRDAAHMAETGDWSGGRAAYFQAPLFTHFLATVYSVGGHNLLLPRLAQVVLGVLTAMGAMVIARRLFGGRAAWIAGLATAIYPMLIFYQGELLAPTLTVFLDVTMFLLLFTVGVRRPGWVWALPGFVFGFRALATTNNLATLPLFWIWAGLYGRRARWSGSRIALAAVAFTVGVAAAVAPVTLRNYAISKQFVLISSNSGLNFYLGNSGDYSHKVELRPGADWDELMNAPLRAGAKTEREMSAFYFKQSWGYISQHPAAYLRLVGYKMYLFLRGDEILRNQEIYPLRAYSAILKPLLWKAQLAGGPGIAFPFGVLLPLAWPGFLMIFKKRNYGGGLLALFIAGYSLSVVAFFVTARYRMPVVIPMILLASFGWAGWRDWWKSRRLRVAAVAGMTGLALVSNWSPGRMSRDMSPDAYVGLASNLAEHGDLSGAERYYRKAIDLSPRDVGAWVNLGLDVYEARGDLESAESCYRRALQIRPGYAIAVFNLGHIAEVRGRTAEAESLYCEAARLDPLMPGPHHNLAALTLSRGEYQIALGLYREARLRDPSNPSTLAGLGVATFKTEGLAAALPFFDEALRIAPDDADAYYNLALAYSQSGVPSKAADAALRLVQVSPRDNQAYLLLARTMQAAGRTPEARRLLEQAAARWPDLAGPRDGLRMLEK